VLDSIAIGVALAATATQKPLAGFDAYVARSLRESRVPGVAVAVVKGDSAILLEGYGVRQLGRPERVTRETLFEIGSTTKAFSAALIAMLVDEGRLGWDDPVIKHLPWFALQDPWTTREVTLRDLLAHRVGLTGVHLAYLKSSREGVIRAARHVDPTVPFRSRYEYSNLMYSAAGHVAEVLTGRPWEVLLRERLLEPLGMRSTTTDLTRFWDSTQFTHCFYCPLPRRPVGLADARPGHDLAMPHMMVGDSVVVIPWQSYDNAVSVGSLVSNASDLARWVRLQLAGGVFGGRRLVSERAMVETHTPHSLIPPAGPIAHLAALEPSTHFWAYGLGWRMNDYRGRKLLWHTGGIIGFLAYVGLMPEERLGIVVLSNGDLGYEMLPQALAYWIVDRFTAAPERDWSAELAAVMRRERADALLAERSLAARRVPGTRPTLPLEAYAGSYSSPVYGEATVAVAGERLRFAISDGAEGALTHWHYDRFRLDLDATRPGPYFAAFRIGPSGSVDGVTIDGLGAFGRKG
jgi:CubicO group peptidase (beta-lactamase class C family)